jgi:outer membrane protein assembly factor BamE (lipoprotein component of BamABCDE complex)
MQTRILAALLIGCALASAAVAETIVVNEQVQVRDSQVDRPKRGLTMDEVEKQFGAPATRHPAVGGSSQQQPPITRWDYTGFSVVFERDRVIDSVVTDGSAPPATGA